MVCFPYDMANTSTRGIEENRRAWEEEFGDSSQHNATNGRHRIGNPDLWTGNMATIHVDIQDSMILMAKSEAGFFEQDIGESNPIQVKQSMLALQESLLDLAANAIYNPVTRGNTRTNATTEYTLMPGISRELSNDGEVETVTVPNAGKMYKVIPGTWIPKQLTAWEDKVVLELTQVRKGYTYLARIIDPTIMSVHIGLRTLAYFEPKTVQAMSMLRQSGTLRAGQEIGAVTIIEVIPLCRVVVVEPQSIQALVALEDAGRLSYSRLDTVTHLFEAEYLNIA